MDILLNILIAVSLFAVFAAMMGGVVALARGGEFAKKHSNRLMRWRVTTQAIAIAVLFVAFSAKACSG